MALPCIACWRDVANDDHVFGNCSTWKRVSAKNAAGQRQSIRICSSVHTSDHATLEQSRTIGVGHGHRRLVKLGKKVIDALLDFLSGLVSVASERASL